jgi:hypothetical protein
MPVSKPIKILFVVTLLLLAMRLAAPDLLRWHVNSLLQQQHGISGRVQDIDLALWRGRYDIKQIEISQHNASGELPLFSARQISIQLSWQRLREGELVSRMVFDQPLIMALDRTQQQDITEEAVLDERTWISLANDLSLLPIDQLVLHDGRLEFNAIAKDIFGELILSSVQGNIDNLHHAATDSLETSVDIRGTVGATAPVTIRGRFNPTSDKPSFDFNLKMAQLPTAATDNIVKIYAPFDIEAGALELAAELACDKGQVSGYVKAGIHQLEVFSWKEDVVADVLHGDDNPLQLFVEGISALLATLLENRSSELLATRIPISGELNAVDTSWLDALSGLAHNAFVRAYNMDVEDIVDIKSVKPEQVDSEQSQD